MYTDPVKSSSEFKTDIRTKVERLGELAESGNIRAASFYGEMLLKGVWDEEALKVDFIRGDLLPVPTEAKSDSNDPYLVLPRDPLKGVEFIKLAAFSTGQEHLYEVTRARCLLTYLQRKSLAGFRNSALSFPYSEGLSLADRFTLDSCAKSFTVRGDEESVGFVALPDVRPSINHRTKMFELIAKNVRNRCFYQCIISIILASVFSWPFSVLNKTMPGWMHFILFQVFNLVLYVIPLCLFAFFISVFGIRERKPICGCSQIKKAYKTFIEKLPVDCRVAKDPYESSSLIVRNLLHIRQFFFWSYMVIVLIALFLCMAGVDFAKYLVNSLPFSFATTNYLPLFLASFIFLNSSMVVLWDKKAPQLVCFYTKDRHFVRSHSGLGFAHLIIIALLGIFYFAFDDRDCSREIEKFEEQDEIEELKDYIIRN